MREPPSALLSTTSNFAKTGIREFNCVILGPPGLHGDYANVSFGLRTGRKRSGGSGQFDDTVRPQGFAAEQ